MGVLASLVRVRNAGLTEFPSSWWPLWPEYMSQPNSPTMILGVRYQRVNLLGSRGGDHEAGALTLGLMPLPD